MKAGTKITFQRLADMSGKRVTETATIGRVLAHMKPVPDGYHPVRFADGGCLMMHQDAFITS